MGLPPLSSNDQTQRAGVDSGHALEAAAGPHSPSEGADLPQVPARCSRITGSACLQIINISSIAAICSTGIVTYKASKAGINSYTQSLAGNARHGIRANVIMPGLMNTPMVIEGISKRAGIPKDELIRRRNAQVPLGATMGTAWHVAYAALLLASEEARFITGVALAVDGGQSARVG